MSKDGSKTKNTTIQFEYSINLNQDELELIQDRFQKICEFCNGVKPPRTHHCKRCNRCTVRMDHHCSWVGNCVGLRNQKYFIQFLFYVMSLGLLHLSDFLWAGINCLIGDVDKTTCKYTSIQSRTVIIFIGLSLVFALYFTFFTFVMMANQMNLIRKNTSTIDLKQKVPRAQDSLLRKIPAAPI